MAPPTAVPVTPLQGSVLIAVATYRRPQDLAEILPLLAAQAAAVAADVRILVVDNDPDGAGAPVCERLAVPGLRYVAEPRPGIAAARNRALAESGDHGLLVFIDDDERPRPGWLEHLLEMHRSTGCAGVVGPVVSSFGGELDPWLVAGGFFDRRRLPTGSLVEVAATNNLLLDLAQVRAAGVDFDERFGLSGGSDTLFTRRLTAAGGRLVWCDEAVVTDVVPADRATRSWALRRRLRIGNSWSRTELAIATSAGERIRARGRLLGAGGARVAGGGARLLGGLVRRDLRLRATGTRTLVRGVGIIAGAVGYTYVEYRRANTATR